MIGKGIEVPKIVMVEKEHWNYITKSMDSNKISAAYKVNSQYENQNVNTNSQDSQKVSTYKVTTEKENLNVRTNSQDSYKAPNGYSTKNEKEALLDRLNSENSKGVLNAYNRGSDRVFMSETSFANTYRQSTDNITQRVKIEQEMNNYREQQQILGQQKQKYLDLDDKRKNLLHDMEKIKQDYAFIENQIHSLQKEEDEIKNENTQLLQSEFRHEEWFSDVKVDFETKMDQVKKLKDEFSLIKEQMEEKKRSMQNSVEVDNNDERYRTLIEEVRNKELELRLKKEQLYEQLRSLK